MTSRRTSTTRSELPDWRDATLDELDRRIIAALQINGRASWKDIATALRATEPTVARRGRRLIETGLVRVVAYIDVLRAGVGVPALVRISCSPRERERLADVIRGRDDVRYATTVTGPADIFAEFVVPSADQLVNVLTRDLPSIHGIQGTETLSVMHTIYSIDPWESSLITDREREDLAARSAGLQAQRPWEAPVTLDAIDHAIMAELTEDGRRSAKGVAASIGTSESTVARRIDRLVTEGCIFFRVVAPAPMLGFNTELMVWLRVDSAHLDEAAQQIIKHSATNGMWVTAGRFNLCASVHTRHLGELYSFETEILGALPIRQVEINTILTTVKRAWFELSPTNLAGPPLNAARAVRKLMIHTSP